MQFLYEKKISDIVTIKFYNGVLANFFLKFRFKLTFKWNSGTKDNTIFNKSHFISSWNRQIFRFPCLASHIY